MNYTRYICQIKKLIFLGLCSILLFSCAQKIINPPVVDVKAQWFKKDNNLQFINGEYKTIPHLFFDIDPDINIKSRELNTVILVEDDGDHHYLLDLVSGRRVYSHSYCSEEDVWKSYSGSISKPPFHYGFVPRLINRRKKPQKVIIFGDKKYLSKSQKKIGNEAVRIRIVGGVVEQFCDSYPCDKLGTWKDSVILVGVAKDDPSYSKVSSIASLSSLVDWKEVKAFLENGRGRSIVAKNTFYPAYRVYGNSAAGKSMKFAIESGHLFSVSELNTLGRTCEALYEKAYGMKNKVKGENLLFNKVFLEFYKEYWNSFETCKKYVRSPDIKEDYKKHWFYEYLHAFSLAVDLGYVYRCDYETWEPNQINYKGHYVYKQSELFVNCDQEELNTAFPKAVNLLSSLAKTGKRYYKYIQYDQGRETYNERIYNWIEFSGTRQNCSEKNILDKVTIFPEDIVWEEILAKEKKEDTIIK